MDPVVTMVGYALFALIIVFIGLLITIVVSSISDSTVSLFDTTDDIKNKKPSGLLLYTDHLTGVQYVGTRKGGLVPRLDKNGQLFSDLFEQSDAEPTVKEKL